MENRKYITPKIHITQISPHVIIAASSDPIVGIDNNDSSDRMEAREISDNQIQDNIWDEKW